jgi:hypothetical protein
MLTAGPARRPEHIAAGLSEYSSSPWGVGEAKAVGPREVERTIAHQAMPRGANLFSPERADPPTSPYLSAPRATVVTHLRNELRIP